MVARALFEEELKRRGLVFRIDADSGRHVVQIGEEHLIFSLENLIRDVATDHDSSRVTRFVDSILASSGAAKGQLFEDQLYWILEPTDYEKKADFRVAFSDRVDRVLAHEFPENRLVAWVTPKMLRALNLPESEAAAKGFHNLARVLKEATIQFRDIDRVRLGFFTSAFPFKASLLLAPNLREVAGETLGWPLHAVILNRDFLFLWAARHPEFAHRVRAVVIQQYSQAAYPISTEVYEITDGHFRAIGEFPT